MRDHRDGVVVGVAVLLLRRYGEDAGSAVGLGTYGKKLRATAQSGHFKSYIRRFDEP